MTGAAIAALTVPQANLFGQNKTDTEDARETVNERDQADRSANQQNAHTGQFQSLGDGEFRMTIDGKNAHTHRLTELTKVTIDGKQATLRELKKGDQIKVTTGKNNVALAIQATRRSTVRGNQPNAKTQQRVRQGVTLGVRLGPSPTTGVLIRDIHPRGEGAQAGLRSGDYILQIDDQKIGSDEDFDQAMSQLKPGDRAELTIWRNRQKQQMTVTFSEERQAAFRPQEDAQDEDGWLGVLLEDAEENQRGVRVARVYPSGPAARAGLERGDMIVQVAGKQVATPDEAAELISNVKPNEQIELTVMRDGDNETIRATLADRRAFFSQTGNGEAGLDQNDPGSFDDSDLVAEHSMMLEQHRRFAQQHERIERKLDEVLDELEELRKQLGQKPANRD